MKLATILGHKKAAGAVKRAWRHVREWLLVLKEEEVGLNWRLWLGMVGALMSGRVTVAVWRSRMRICRGCPIYDRELRRCRAYLWGQSLGCGCYVVFIAKTKEPYPGGCWARWKRGAGYGWGAD